MVPLLQPIPLNNLQNMKSINPNYFYKDFEHSQNKASHHSLLLLIFFSIFFIPISTSAQCDSCIIDSPLAIQTIYNNTPLSHPSLYDDYDKIAVSRGAIIEIRNSENLLLDDDLSVGASINNHILTEDNSGEFKIFISQNNGIVRCINSESASIEWTSSTARVACSNDNIESAPVYHPYINASASFQSNYPNQLIYVGTSYGCVNGDYANRVYALNPNTGHIEWIFNLTGSYEMGRVIGTPHLDVETDRLFVSTDRYDSVFQPSIWCIDVITGTLDWSFNANHQYTGPIVLGDRVYLVSFFGNITVLEKSTGAFLWSLSNGEVPVIDQHSVTVAPNGDIIIAITDFNGNVAMARDDGNTGSWLWNVTMPDTASSPPQFGPLGDKVYFGTRAGKIEQRDALTGILDTIKTVDTGGWVTSLDIHNYGGISALFSSTDIGVMSKHCVPFRKPSSPSMDSDGDGVFDHCDADDDNDGILDIMELGDTDGDNLSDFIDPDSDNDGCFDVVESGGKDPNGDTFFGDAPVIVDGVGRVQGALYFFPPGDAFRDSTDFSICCTDDLSIIDLCAVVQADSTSILALADCDKDGGSNIFECNNNFDPTDAFVTTWEIGPSDSITIPLQAGTYDFSFHWTLLSDTSIQISGTHTNADGDFVSNFVESGIYCLAISGEFPHLKGYPADKLLDVIQWGNIFWLSAEDMFHNWPGTSFTAKDVPILSLVTSMEGMFHSATNFNGDIGHWDVSSICDMTAMFAFATAFNSSLSSWNVSIVESMDSMFYDADSFNGFITFWNVGNVLTMNRMFMNADAFNYHIGYWDISQVTDLHGMFAFTTDFNQSLENWTFDQSTILTKIFQKAKGINCENLSTTFMKWNYMHPDIIDKDLGNSNFLEYDQYAKTAVTELEARGWFVPGNESAIDCVPLDKKYWTGAKDHMWDDPLNWNPSFVPVNGDQVIIPKRVNHPIIDKKTAKVKSVQTLKDALMEITLEGELKIEE